MMQTFYIDKRDVDHKRLIVKGDVCHHITRVLRMRVGEHLRFSDNEAYYYEGTIAAIEKDSVEVAIDDYYSIEDEPALQVTLIQCLPRGDKMDQILQKSTELGVAKVIPAESENSLPLNSVYLTSHKVIYIPANVMRLCTHPTHNGKLAKQIKILVSAVNEAYIIFSL